MVLLQSIAIKTLQNVSKCSLKTLFFDFKAEKVDFFVRIIKDLSKEYLMIGHGSSAI